MVNKNLTIILMFVLMVLFTGCGSSEPEYKVISLKKGPQLFIDDYLIENQSFLTRTVNQPDKLPDPVVKGGTKFDDNWQPYFSVIWDKEKGVYKMWYNVPVEDLNTMRCHIGYMESKDGINWISPHKVLKDPHPIQFGVSVIDRGPEFENQSERYVLASYLKPGMRISTSPDGLNWKVISEEPVLYHNHDICSISWDPVRKQFFALVSHRMAGFGDSTKPNIDDRRRIAHESTSKNLTDWKEIWPVCMPKIGAPKEDGETQFYTMGGTITRGDLIIGLVKVLRDDLNATPGMSAKEMGDMNRKAAGIGYTVLAWTRDGVTWQRDYQPFIDRNPVPGTFDHAMAWGDAQIIVGNKVYIYYAGYERGHKVERFKERHIGFASMLRDRYVSRDADFNGGSLITKHLILNADKITFNANVVGVCRVRLVDENREPIDGFGWAELKGDSVDQEIDWSDNIGSLSGATVCLEFEMKNAQLYGFNLQ